MRYFHRLTGDAMVMPLLHAVQRNHELWDMDTARTSFDGSPHAQAHDILLRCCDTANQTLSEAYVDLESVDRPAFHALPKAKDTCLDLMRLVGGSRLGRVVITRLEPGKKIAPHKDEGAYAEYYSRYHLVLQGLPSSLFRCGDETVSMQTGELWWFDASAEHEVMNNSKDDRVHMPG